MHQEQYQVVIVGGGPVGFGAAIDLAQRGVKVLVIEKYPALQPIPKGQNLTQRTMEHFRAWHAEDELRAARVVPSDYGNGGVTIYGELVGPYYYDWHQRFLLNKFYATPNERLPQYATEAVLRERAAQLDNIDVLLGWEVEQVEQDATQVRVSAVERSTGQRREFTAQYAIGADGSRSVARDSAKITRYVSEQSRPMVLLVFYSEKLNQLVERFPDKSYYAVLHPELEGYWRFIGREDAKGNFFFHAPVAEDIDPDTYDFSEPVRRAVGADIDIEIRHKGLWDSRVGIAKNYRSGRIFVAGDAAHNHPPYGGYGINSGFEDVRNLSWKLAAVLNKQAPDALLDSYDLERRPVFESTAYDFILKGIEEDRKFLATYSPDADKAKFEQAWQQRSEGAADEVDRFQPNYRGSRIVWGDDSGVSDAVSPHRFEARAGYHLAPRDIRPGVSVFDELGSGFSLLSVGDNADAVAQFQAAAGQLGIDLTVITAQADSDAVQYQAPLVLVRPDHFVAWAGNADGLDGKAILSRALDYSA